MNGAGGVTQKMQDDAMVAAQVPCCVWAAEARRRAEIAAAVLAEREACIEVVWRTAKPWLDTPWPNELIRHLTAAVRSRR